MPPAVLRGLCLAIALGACAPGSSFAQTDPHSGHRPPGAPNPAGESPSDPPVPQTPLGELPAFIPPVTPEDRGAAFPDVPVHAVHDRAIGYFVLLDRLEWQAGADSTIDADLNGWIGRARDRLWVRAEARKEEGQAHLLYGRLFSRWWDVVAGMRHDVDPGPAQTWAAVGIQGLSPYWFHVEATGYVGASGRTQARFELEYELLVTKRIVLQPLIEVNVFGRSDPERGIGAGLSSTEAGIRLRYEIKRELAPYVGVTWDRAWGRTADYARASGQETGGARAVVGLRTWF